MIGPTIDPGGYFSLQSPSHSTQSAEQTPQNTYVEGKLRAPAYDQVTSQDPRFVHVPFQPRQRCACGPLVITTPIPDGRAASLDAALPGLSSG